MHNIRYSAALKASLVIRCLICYKLALIKAMLTLSGSWLLKGSGL